MPAQRKLSPRQLELLLEFAESHTNVALGRFQGPQASQAARQAWKSLAFELNCVAQGTFKTPDQWRRYWIEFKARTKTKAADSRRNASNTGGGSSKFVPLNAIEERVLALIGQVAVEGLPEVRIFLSIPTEEVASPSTILGIPHNINTNAEALNQEHNIASPVPLFQPPQETTRTTSVSPITNHHQPSLSQRDDGHSQISNHNPHPSNHQRLRTSRRLRRDPNVPRWAYDLEMKRIETEERRTVVAEKQVEVQQEIVNEMKGIKLALLELTAIIKDNKLS